MKSKKTDPRPRNSKKVSTSNKLNKTGFHPLLDKLLELGFKLLETKI